MLDLLRGAASSSVTLRLQRPGGAPRDVPLQRDAFVSAFSGHFAQPPPGEFPSVPQAGARCLMEMTGPRQQSVCFLADSDPRWETFPGVLDVSVEAAEHLPVSPIKPRPGWHMKRASLIRPFR